MSSSKLALDRGVPAPLLACDAPRELPILNGVLAPAEATRACSSNEQSLLVKLAPRMRWFKSKANVSKTESLGRKGDAVRELMGVTLADALLDA